MPSFCRSMANSQLGGPSVAGANVAIEAALIKACNPQISERRSPSTPSTQRIPGRARATKRQDGQGDFGDDCGSRYRARARCDDPRAQLLLTTILIDEKDIQIYEDGVAISDGRPTAVDRFVRSTAVDPVLVSHANAASQLAVPVANSLFNSTDVGRRRHECRWRNHIGDRDRGNPA